MSKILFCITQKKQQNSNKLLTQMKYINILNTNCYTYIYIKIIFCELAIYLIKVNF